MARIPVGDSYFLMFHHGYQVENDAFWGGVDATETHSVRLWSRYCRRSKVIFDVGANTGIYALLAKTLNPEAKVYAFECVERVALKLKRNITLNNFDIGAVEFAMSDFNGRATIYDVPDEHTYGVTVNENRQTRPDVVKKTIATKRLDTFIEQECLDRVDLMKVDVETHEAEVLSGMGAYLTKFRPAIFAEVLTDEAAQKLEGVIKGLNYLYYDLSGAPRKVNSITANPVHGNVHNYLLYPSEGPDKP